ncbi:PEP-CTERM sorting domain-containing protein [Geminisphaera colitermitum]|uniref:PEP-CTERM sorting domain-containing protein n=1 Tax=Geminisphaera colitermitum TaxID=1148786 RepID=UPI000158C515|nr:PEP-CTERM sorting domain-containing protein [Geminisphaera colitermitum]
MKTKITTTCTRFLTIIAAASLLVSSAVHADVLAFYDFDLPNNDSAITFSPTSKATNIANGVASWSGVTGTYGFGGSANTAFIRGDNSGPSFNDAKYMTFTIEAASGYMLNLTSLSLYVGGSNQSTTTDRSTSTQVRTNVGDAAFNTSLALTGGNPETSESIATVAVLKASSGTTYAYETYTVDLSAPKYQSLTAITFRIYGYGSGGVNNAFWRLDNMTLNGTVTEIPTPNVPEPATTALLIGGSLLAFMLWLRRSNIRRK